MDKACDDLKSDLDNPLLEFVKDVWQAEFLRTFKGPIPGALFINRHDEGHYGLTFNVNFFVIEGMWIQGARTSCGLISMACLNLLYEIYYQSENMYMAGIIPSPKEPSLMELNYYLKPVIDDLATLWKTGFHYSKTALYSSSHTVHCTIIAAVIDLLAACKTSQLAPVTSYFYCSICQCHHLDTLGRTDYEKWELHDSKELQQHVEKWKNPSTLKDQEDIFKSHGIHWSEMWHLPYWDPTHQLVVNTMHCILEGIAQHHFCVVLGLTDISAANKPEDT